jgi:hypothetical protein
MSATEHNALGRESEFVALAHFVGDAAQRKPTIEADRRAIRRPNPARGRSRRLDVDPDLHASILTAPAQQNIGHLADAPRPIDSHAFPGHRDGEPPMKQTGPARFARHAALVVLGIAGLAVPAGAAAPPAQADRTTPDRRLLVGPRVQLARILSPSDSGLVSGRAVRARVRVSSRVRLFGAWLDGEDVTARFRRAGGGRRVARIAAPPPLRPGVHHLVVRTAGGRGRRDFDEARFIVVRRRPSLLRLTASRRVAAGGRATRGPLPVTLRLARGVDRAVLRLNRRRVNLGPVAGRLRVRLSADDGLRFGRNRLRVRAHREAGEWDVERRLIVVPRSHPLAAAGRDRTVRGRGSIRLDATGSLPTGRGTDLNYRWTVLRPEGAQARLSSARSARPRLRVDRPGRYRMAVTVSEGGRGARDEMTVVGQPNYPPIGAAFDTAASVDGVPIAIRIGTQTYTYAYGFPYLLVLDRRTLEAVDEERLPGGAPGYQAYQDKLAELAGRAAQQRTQYLAILRVAEGAGGGGFPDDGYTRIDRLTWDPAHPTSDAGSLENDGGRPSTPAGLGLPGQMTGYLQLDTQGYYTPVQTPFQAFRTGQRPGQVNPVAAFVTVGDATEARCEADPNSPAFLVLPFRRDHLAEDIDLPVDWCYHVNGGSRTEDQNQQERMASGLQKIHDAGDLVFIQSIGNPRPTTPSWGKIAAAIESLGGSAQIFNTLDGSGPYALVGCNGCEWPQAIESSYPETRTEGDGSLAGTLGLDEHSRWTPLVGDGRAALDYGLLRVAYQPPSPWPYMDTPGRRAAYAWIWDRAKNDRKCGGCDVFANPPNDRSDWCQRVDDLRASYCSDTAPLDKLQIWLQTLESSGGRAPSGDTFTGEDFDEVQTELLNELGHRDVVRSVIDLIKGPLELSGANTLEPRDIADAIKASLIQQPSEADRITATVADLLVGGLNAISGIAPPEAKPVAALTTVMYGAASKLADDQSGQPAFDIGVVATDIGYQMATRLDETRVTLDRIKEIILSDAAKLTAVATGYAANQDQVDALVPQLKLGTTQWLWQELLPRAWGLFKLAYPPPGKRINDLNCPVIIPYYPWGDQSDGMSYTPVTGFNDDLSPQREWWAQGNITNIYSSGPEVSGHVDFKPPGGSLYDHFFDQPASYTDIKRPGLDKIWFFRRAQDWRFTYDWVKDGPPPSPTGSFCHY